MKTALITGITGQDGSYLAELLASKGYRVHGTYVAESPESAALSKQAELHAWDLNFRDPKGELRRLIESIKPDELYHLGASSFVDLSYEAEATLLDQNLIFTHHLLAALYQSTPKCRLFFAGSAEMFGNPDRSPQDESTAFRPRSVYGISKVAAHQLVAYYRANHGLHASTGILYNHESPRRPPQFVTRKITRGAALIKLGRETKLTLGDLDAQRDWGYAPEYAQAMWLMLQQEQPDDYVIATGTLHSVREWLELAFGCVGLDYRNHVEVDPRLFRPVEKMPACGNPAKARKTLGWSATRSLREIVEEMVREDLKRLS